MKLIKYLLILQFIVFFFSCKAPEDVVYFQNAKNLEEIKVKNIPQVLFQEGDLLSIRVSAVDKETTIPFNLDSAVQNQGQEGASNSGSQYLVDLDGTIDFPVLGKIKVAGLSRSETSKLITEKLGDYINNPSVAVKINNFNITVLGEVSRPGTYPITNGKVDVIQALGLAGDLTIKGKRENILVIREKNQSKVYHKIDITSKDMFNQPAFFLKQNDIVYVEPNGSKVKTSRTNNNTFGIILSVMGVVLSIATIIR